MDFDLTAAEEQFRDELRRFLDEQLPNDWETRSFTEGAD